MPPNFQRRPCRTENAGGCPFFFPSFPDNFPLLIFFGLFYIHGERYMKHLLRQNGGSDNSFFFNLLSLFLPFILIALFSCGEGFGAVEDLRADDLS